MNLQKYIAFLTTVETNSLTKTAELMDYTQPGISHMLSSLEEEMGFPLLIRTKGGIFPTANAKQLVYYMQQIVNAEEALQQTAKQILGLETGSIRIGTFTSTAEQWLPSIIASFTQKHPGIDLQISTGIFSEVQGKLRSGAIELAFMSSPDTPSIEFIPLWSDPIVVLMSDKNPLAAKEIIDPKYLADYPLIIPNDGADEAVWQVLKAEKIHPTVRFKIQGDAAIYSLVRENLGITLVPKLTITTTEGLAARPLTISHCRIMGIAIPSLSLASPATKVFVEMSQEYISNQWIPRQLSEKD